MFALRFCKFGDHSLVQSFYIGSLFLKLHQEHRKLLLFVRLQDNIILTDVKPYVYSYDEVRRDDTGIHYLIHYQT
jgi:hypothetical protein